jgi:hypothetical protein
MAEAIIRSTVAPSLPIAMTDYSQQYTDQYSNILRLYFNQLDNFTRAVIIPLSGTTAARPAERLLIGQTYFDTTLGIPIWYNGTNWVNSAGTTV